MAIDTTTATGPTFDPAEGSPDPIPATTDLTMQTTVPAWMQVQAALDDRLSGLLKHRAATRDPFTIDVLDTAIADVRRARSALLDMLYARTRLEVGIALFGAAVRS